ncbi:MAG: hypothetical protein IPK80_09545 [Nannocystis sp.]|jgi:hypothetical protein|nr:hypothetical protein [Nannocystis sp.]
MSAAIHGALALALASPPAEVIGGYRDATELREPEPDDGEQRVMIGGLLFALGLLRSAAGVAQSVTMTPGRCQQIYGKGVSDRACSGLRTYGFVSAGYGGLMAAVGVGFLAWGLVSRQRYRLWQQRRGVIAAPLSLPRGGGLMLELRF